MENAIITGATKGIGRAIAIAFAKQGLNLAVCSRNEQELLLLRDELQKLNPGIQVLTKKADASVKNELLAFAAYAEQQLGFICVVINNVGMYKECSILDDGPLFYSQMMDTNLMPTYELYRYFGKSMMAAGKGHIFNICSVAAINPVANAGMYSVTKAAQLSLNKVMRLEMQESGVKVTAILPGSTLTGSWQGTNISPERFVSPTDISSAIINIYQMKAGANVDELVIKPVLGQL